MSGSDVTALDVVVAEKTVLAEDVVHLRLVHPDGAALPAWEPGAHVDLLLPGGTVRQYSLCGDPGDSSSYRIGVLRERSGRGGSRTVHDTVEVGELLAVRGPRNHFALVDAPAYLFIAGGIGITPILPMLAQARASGASVTVLYGGRSRASMAFVDEVLGYVPGARICPQDEVGLLDMDFVLATAAPGTAIYCCGPEPLLAAVEATTAHRLPGALHVERFASAAPAPSATGSFRVSLQRSGIDLDVPAGRSILEAVTAAGVDVLSSCEDGVCGTCLTTVLEGVPEHHDSVLSAGERNANGVMALCVSRARPGATIVLDL